MAVALAVTRKILMHTTQQRRWVFFVSETSVAIAIDPLAAAPVRRSLFGTNQLILRTFRANPFMSPDVHDVITAKQFITTHPNPPPSSSSALMRLTKEYANKLGYARTGLTERSILEPGVLDGVEVEATRKRSCDDFLALQFHLHCDLKLLEAACVVGSVDLWRTIAPIARDHGIRMLFFFHDEGHVQATSLPPADPDAPDSYLRSYKLQDLFAGSSWEREQSDEALLLDLIAKGQERLVNSNSEEDKFEPQVVYAGRICRCPTATRMGEIVPLKLWPDGIGADFRVLFPQNCVRIAADKPIKPGQMVAFRTTLQDGHLMASLVQPME